MFYIVYLYQGINFYYKIKLMIETEVDYGESKVQ